VLDARSLTRATILADLLFSYPQQWGRDQFIVADCDLEDGRNLAAIERLQQLLERDPETELRAIAVFYKSTITGQPPVLFPPSQEIPIWKGLIAEDSETPEGASSAQPAVTPAAETAEPSAVDPPRATEPPAPSTSERRAPEAAP
jgi:hypothetical protein